jgi:OmpA-OmpF porin, OOP family
MRTLRGIALMGSFLLLAACSNTDGYSEVEALNEVQAVGSPFTQALAAEYRIFANRELDQMFDYPDALHFARKGLAAAAGEAVMPEPISDWNLLPEHMTELGTARGRLIVAFDLGARDVAPGPAAVAQARFDCWIEQQEENWQESDIAGCKNQFMETMAALEGMLKPAEAMAPVEAAPAAPTEPLKPEDAMYLVFFDFDSFKIGAGGENVMDAVAQEVKGRSLNVVHVVGHTDSSGPETYNDKLAMKRANAVRDALVNRGVDAALVNVEGRGENELLVKTADGVREPANRRAQVTFE